MRQHHPDAFVSPRSAAALEADAQSFIRRVYTWMTVGLLLTGLSSFFAATNPTLSRLLFGNPLVFYGLIIGELAMVFAFNTVARRASATATMALFLAYSLVNGLTLSVIFFAYTADSIAQVFFVSTATFASMSIYGFVTKRDLTSVGSFAMMGLWGVLIAGLVNIFLRSDMVGFIAACAGVLVFVGLTAYDTQKLKELNASMADEDPEAVSKRALTGALILYLDFINLFLMLLRLFGRRR